MMNGKLNLKFSGIAFPTCISVNNTICHYSPLVSEPDVTIQDGDVVKLDFGCHLDGFVAVVAHTVVVGASAENPVSLNFDTINHV